MKKILTLLFSVLTLAVFSQTENPNTDSLILKDLFSSEMKEGVSCYRIPALVTAPNGDLIAAIDERVPSCGDLQWSEDINIVIRRSFNNGETWSEIETVVDYPLGQSASDPSLIVDQTTGVIFLFFNYMDVRNEKNVYYFKLTKSSDNGQTWSTPFDITSQISKPEWHTDFKFITSGRGIQTRSGKLVHTLVNLKNGLHLFGSDDHGESWYLIDNPIQPGDESKIVELADGSWMINSRVNGEGFRYVHTSTDEGKTWQTKPDFSLIDPGCNASIIRYSSVEEGADKNRLLFSNANSKDKRNNMTIKISYDEGKTWTTGKTIYTGGSAYSSMTVLENGDIGLFFEKENYQHNVFVQLSLEWLTDGEDTFNLPPSK